ncbi:50S ribosomal protein-like protein L4 [Hyaloscypha bicolor E]|uniref:Large ribosomal subunit protein uL4m n=1 Tax=Hyaloscypha bicolor E TaxID=1095630 RepID=A0A2J6T883_9HELO|nr:50S ribosomal protein-like protein L4 [Hyaloscypha bicolor E]PMD59229.1 50S ribosomal protein-like protein L4 [Hyaloscypha bicolor E]
MASKRMQSFSRSLKTLRTFNSTSKDPLTQCLAPGLSRSMATETSMPSQVSREYDPTFLQTATDPAFELQDSVLTTIYKFPTMEPLRFESYASKHLHLPLRRDILHRAVIFEGDFTRQGTASTKTRWEIHGSHRKIRPQKGTGMARLGTRQSPMLKGGGKSFGPHPRDFATALPKKMYDLAWRTALSWRYRRGELIVCEDGMDIEHPKTRFARQIFEHNHWGREDGRSLVITGSFKKNLFRALRHAGEDGRVQMVKEVDVKDLLELGRVIIEKRALDEILSQHQSDLVSKVRSAV